MMNYSEMAAALGREIDKMFDEARDIASKAVAAERERCMREIATLNWMPHSGDWMTVREAERLAALWCAGQPLDDLPQWRTAMQVLARELADTRAALKNANDHAESQRPSRALRAALVLTDEDACRYAVAKTMETFKVRGAAELNQALDDAMAEDADARKDIARVLKYWLDNNERQAAAEGRAITPATHVMPTEWPDRGTLANWIAVLRA